MSKLDTNVDAWADALRGTEDSDRGRTGGRPDVLVERRTERAEGERPGVELRVRDPAGDVSSVVLSPREARTLAEQLRSAADPASEHGDAPDGA